MVTFHQFGTGLCSGICCLCLSTGCAAQYDASAPSNDTPPCRIVAGQAEIDGVMQQITGRACLQPDGSWQMVEGDGTALASYPAPVYYYDPWYWGPPVVFGGGVSFVFVDRFHHHHHMDHVRMGGHGDWHGGNGDWRGGHGDWHGGGHGGWHGTVPMQGAGGMSHGGGGMRR
ncbi:hypothetical protein [Paraburkholderia sp. SIMBA_030]|uniref:hypothetical protein n=1 Tax=Paraburkholderia sp. SIMBA_030 TaxID=3085773 RepID=UPI00397B79D3